MNDIYEEREYTFRVKLDWLCSEPGETLEDAILGLKSMFKEQYKIELKDNEFTFESSMKY